MSDEPLLTASKDDAQPLGLGLDRSERSLFRLRRGGWLTPGQVIELQRTFLLDAMTDAAAELGYGEVSVEEVITRAGVSRRTFYDIFRDRDECLLAAVRRAHDRVTEAACLGYQSSRGAWSVRLRAAVVELLALLDARRSLARLCLVQAPAGRAEAVIAHRTLVVGLAGGLATSASRSGIRQPVPERVARGMVSGAFALVCEQVAAPEPPRQPLVELTGDVMYGLVAPLQGLAAARRQLGLPAPAPVQDWSVPAAVPPEGARWHAEVAGQGERKQILRFLVGHPGATNQLVRDHLQTTDSTASRRLAGMARDGLIVTNKRGRWHAWHVTDRGRATLEAG